MAAETILVVEDDSDIRLSLIDVLQAEGYRTLEAADGEKALGLFAKGNSVDLILLDDLMPHLTDQEFLQRRKKIASIQSIPVIFMTTTHQKELNEDPLVRFLTKPFEIDDLLSEIKRALKQPS